MEVSPLVLGRRSCGCLYGYVQNQAPYKLFRRRRWLPFALLDEPLLEVLSW